MLTFVEINFKLEFNWVEITFTIVTFLDWLFVEQKSLYMRMSNKKGRAIH